MTSDSVAKTMILHPEGIRAPIKIPISRGVSSTLQHFHNDINKVDTLELEFDCVLSSKPSFCLCRIHFLYEINYSSLNIYSVFVLAHHLCYLSFVQNTCEPVDVSNSTMHFFSSSVL